jgi:hypothetical protein
MDLLVVFGPPAVGKMTVGAEVARLTGYRLFHNHMTVEPILELFDFGSPPFMTLVSEIRTRVIEEAAASDLRGLILTLVWDVDDAGDRAEVERYTGIVEARGGVVRFVELLAPLAVRLQRNVTPERLDVKRSKRDTAASEGWVRSAEQDWVMNTRDTQELSALVGGRACVRIDNADLAPETVAKQVVEAFGL